MITMKKPLLAPNSQHSIMITSRKFQSQAT
jgi:hypothetical protein